MSAVYVWIETFQGKAIPAAWEALSAGKQIADQFGVPLTALVFGANAAAVAAEAATYGASKALVSDDATLKEFRVEAYAALLTKLVKDNAPKAVLAVASSRGRELLAASAADTDSPLLGDILSLSVEGGSVTAERAVYAGKILSENAITGGATMFITVRSRTFQGGDAECRRQRRSDDGRPGVERRSDHDQGRKLRSRSRHGQPERRGDHRVGRARYGEQPEGCSGGRVWRRGGGLESQRRLRQRD